MDIEAQILAERRKAYPKEFKTWRPLHPGQAVYNTLFKERPILIVTGIMPGDEGRIDGLARYYLVRENDQSPHPIITECCRAYLTRPREILRFDRKPKRKSRNLL